MMKKSKREECDADQLVERVRVLFGVVTPESEAADSPYAASATIENFHIPIPASHAQPVDPACAAAAWLATPNPSFGGACPQSLVDGTDAQRAFLASVLSSIEDGAFS